MGDADSIEEPTADVALIDENAAWEMVRAIPPGLEGRKTARVRYDPLPDAWLQVHDNGTWDLSGEFTDDARSVLDVFVPIAVPRSLVIGQLGQSLDGRIATLSGHSHYVTGDADLRRLHRVRALVDAVVVGVGTVEADDPQLTVRIVPGNSPVRVILDPKGRIDSTCRVCTDGQAPTLIVRGGGSQGADVVGLEPDEQGRFTARAILDALATRGLRRILIEGGAFTVSHFLQQKALDRLHITVAPLLLGSGRASITLPPISTLDEALRPKARQFSLGPDVLFDLDFI